MVTKRYMENNEVNSFSSQLVDQIGEYNPEGNKFFTRVVGIERGGVPLAKTISKAFNLPLSTIKISYYIGEEKQDAPVIDMRGITFSANDVVLIVDDLVDTGDTVELLKRMLDELCIPSKVAVFFQKPHSSVTPDFFVETTDEWIVFPWERDE